ncbi:MULTISPECIES: type II toxin-antitoxin system HicA family toxin [unclassified Pantoea]|uniref:type II toxin-antitoxin system HicA family toxin n=1 Tax=unclassified Pantoea TaxID=2630326 RepID=UPI001CD426CC|nr:MULTISPECIES: type II toxin-antitoxin system HicA family toxin [unclassified Pantoea]MCA1176798.1 type II toxin-antitoxin system HicA family toxin [Pantoea sp. alder69]MCA1251250.1 type II toxin-antitoxin system HicA family toxin [Pantoea sp. alder70]MCA1265601.1 type II toxin-antitoxin system HicA family toxin [Pantoea sp. alder81]
MSSRELIRMLLERGWVLDRVKGSHHVFVRADKPYHISLPHPEKDLAIGTLRKLIKLMD